MLWKCFLYFTKQLDSLEYLETDGKAVAAVLSETAARQLMFILITVDDELNAYTVFETLNARGLNLTTTDLLKNYLFSLVTTHSDLEALQRRWAKLIATVDYKRFAEFLRYHLLCKESKVRTQRLFRLVRSRIRSKENVFELLTELESRVLPLFVWNRFIQSGSGIHSPTEEAICFGVQISEMLRKQGVTSSAQMYKMHTKAASCKTIFRD